MPTRIGRTVSALAVAVLLATVAACGALPRPRGSGQQFSAAGRALGRRERHRPRRRALDPYPDAGSGPLTANVKDGARKVDRRHRWSR